MNKINFQKYNCVQTALFFKYFFNLCYFSRTFNKLSFLKRIFIMKSHGKTQIKNKKLIGI